VNLNIKLHKKSWREKLKSILSEILKF
jgi:hypothetical protein